MANTILTDTNVLNQMIERSGLKRKYIAEKLSLSPYGLAKKINGENEFRPSEIEILCRLLGIKTMKQRMDIFFKTNVDK